MSRLRYNLERTVAPTAAPVTLPEAKYQCNVELDETFFDNWFEGGRQQVGAIDAATALVEHNCTLALMPQTWVLKLDDWTIDGCSEEDYIDLRVHPVQSIAVSYVDAAGSTQTLGASNYEVERSTYRSRLLKTDSSWSFPNLSTTKPRPITITCTSGYSTATDEQTQRDAVPNEARQAILTIVEHWFNEGRSAVLVGRGSKEIELGYKSLISAIRPARYR